MSRQVDDRRPRHIGRRTSIDLPLVGDVKATLTALLPKVRAKSDSSFLDDHIAETRDFYGLLNHTSTRGRASSPSGRRSPWSRSSPRLGELTFRARSEVES